MSKFNNEIAKQSWQSAPDSHITKAIKNIQNYDIEVQDIIIQEAENRFGQSSAEKIVNHSSEQETQRKEYKGIGRLNFLFITFAGVALCAAIVHITKRNEFVILLLKTILLLFSASLTYLRLKNIGWNGWWALLALVPGLNFFIAIPCYIFPGGFQQTKKLDIGSWITIGIFLLLLIMLITVLLNQ